MTAPLHPRGTLRARFEPAATRPRDVFRRLGVGARSCDLGDQGLYLAEELVAADVGWLGSGEQPEALAIVVLALMIAQRQGSTRLPLGAQGPLRALVTEIGRLAGLELDTNRVLRTIANLTSAPRFNSVIGARDARLPLVVEDGCLYTERSRWLEHRVATRLAQRLSAPPPPAAVDDPPTTLESALAATLEGSTPPTCAPAPSVGRSEHGSSGPSPPGPSYGGPRLAPPAASPGPAHEQVERFLDELRVPRPGMRALTEEQIGAVRVALTGRIAVVTGGPGTGKTVVAAAIVRGLAHLGVEHIALAAQTGKAANRLTEVIGQQLAALGDAGAAAPVAQTLHRLLGYRGGRFAHHAQSPLPVGAVLVDEASMIDLELIDALLDALPPSAPLILIGDAHQLPAIDAGQVLADLAEPGSVATPRVAMLRHSFRMDMDDVHGRAVYEAARAVHDGELHRLFERRGALAVARTPGTLAFRGVEWVDTASARMRPQEATLAVAEALWHHVEGPHILRLAERVFEFTDGRIAPEQRDELEALWRLLGRARILTATRALPTGSLAINDHLHHLALERMSVAGRPDFVPGEPVMITANDYQRGLFNGDQGIVVRADEGLGRHHYRALFRHGGELRPFAIEALRDRLELSWALTVHKSQGSELDAIALVVPHEDLPLLTRELLYTAITRARTGVAIAGARPILTAAGKRRALRYSGLGPRLRAALGA